jgi:enoyl-CoA hydratase
MSEAEAVANKICENGPLAVRAMKQLVNQGSDLDYRSVLNLSEHIIGHVLSSEDFKEGWSAFMEKRKPQ